MAVLWVIILLSVSGLLSTTRYLSDVGDTPFLPLWFDDMKRIRLRRRRALLSTADSVLELHDRRAAPPTDAAAR